MAVKQMRVTHKMYFKIFLSLLFAMIIIGCDKDSKKYDLKNKEECIAPQNPYNDGGGHDAGFNWAAETGGDCNGRSNSFNDGCEEYYRQQSKYNKCVEDNY